MRFPRRLVDPAPGGAQRFHRRQEQQEESRDGWEEPGDGLRVIIGGGQADEPRPHVLFDERRGDEGELAPVERRRADHGVVQVGQQVGRRHHQAVIGGQRDAGQLVAVPGLQEAAKAGVVVPGQPRGAQHQRQQQAGHLPEPAWAFFGVHQQEKQRQPGHPGDGDGVVDPASGGKAPGQPGSRQPGARLAGWRRGQPLCLPA